MYIFPITYQIKSSVAHGPSPLGFKSLFWPPHFLSQSIYLRFMLQLLVFPDLAMSFFSHPFAHPLSCYLCLVKPYSHSFNKCDFLMCTRKCMRRLRFSLNILTLWMFPWCISHMLILTSKVLPSVQYTETQLSILKMAVYWLLCSWHNSVLTRTTTITLIF